jgi:uncharacterized membrane protein YqjE
MSSPAASGGEGLFAALRRAGASLAAMAVTRLELASAEVAELRGEFVRLLALALGAAAFAFLGLVAASLLIAVIFWETHRIEALVALVAVYLVIAALLGLRLRRALRESPALFEATMSEFRRDAEALRGARAQGQEPQP